MCTKYRHTVTEECTYQSNQKKSESGELSMVEKGKSIGYLRKRIAKGCTGTNAKSDESVR